MVRVFWVVAVFAFCIGMSWGQGKSMMEPMKVKDLRCEFRTDPMGVDAEHPRLSWTLQDSDQLRSQRQSSYRILVASSLEGLSKGTGDLWDTGRVESSAQNNIPYEGSPLKSGKECYWKVMVWDGAGRPSTWSKVGLWATGLLKASDWKGVWINDGKKNPTEAEDFYKDDPAPLFRKEFKVNQKVKSARLMISGLGYYEATLNGKKIGDHVLDPGWTEYGHRVFYSTYDVAPLLASGANCLGVTLGNGWYNPLPLKMWGNRNIRETLTIGRPRFIAQLVVTYADGNTETVVSDKFWRVTDGPMLRNSVYLGEVYDARKELRGWDLAGFDDSGWRTPGVASEQIGELVAQPQPPIRETARWKAVAVHESKPGVFVYDLGRNFAGWAQLKLNVARGTVVKIRYGELLYKDGSLNPMTSVAGQIKSKGVGGPGAPDVAWQSDTYIAKGGGEVYTPRFTFHGFRYVEVTGLDQALPLGDVTAIRLNSDVADAGSFSSSDETLNRIQAMCRETFLSNIFSVQSDCPHRERFGYGGDLSATCEAFMSNFDMEAFYAKAVRDWSDSALDDGMFTDTAPFVGIQYCGVGWAMAHPVLVTQLRRYYGNTRLESEQYAAAKRWLHLVEKQYPTGIVTDGLSDHEGLEPAPAPVMVTPLYYQSAKMLESMANHLDKKGDAANFGRLADRIRAEYLTKFVDAATGKVGPGTQASQAFALSTGIVPDSLRAKVTEYLVSRVSAKDDHLSTGLYGTKFLFDSLSRGGRADVALKIANQKSFPGFGWMLENGATTIWEHWEMSDNTFSHNHPMFGSISQWMMQWLGGIQPADNAVGYDKIEIRPQTVGGLTFVKSSYKSIRGEIVSNWKKVVGGTEFEVVVPVNSTARVWLPGGTVSEGGKPLSEMKGLKGTARSGRSTVVTVGSGHYRFVVVD